MFWFIPIAIVVADILMDVSTGVDIIEFATGYDVIGTGMDYVATAITGEDYGFADKGGLLTPDGIPTVPELLGFGSGSVDIDSSDAADSSAAVSSTIAERFDQLEETIYGWFSELADGIGSGFDMIAQGFETIGVKIDTWGYTLLIAIVIVGVFALASFLVSAKNGRRLRELGGRKR